MNLYRRFCVWQSGRLRRHADDLELLVDQCTLLQVAGTPDLPAGEIDAAEREIADMRTRADAWERRSRT